MLTSSEWIITNKWRWIITYNLSALASLPSKFVSYCFLWTDGCVSIMSLSLTGTWDPILLQVTMAMCQFLTLFFSNISYILHPNIKRSTLSTYGNLLRLYTNILFTVALNFIFKVKWKCVKFWVYLCNIFYVLHPNANEIFQKN